MIENGKYYIGVRTSACEPSLDNEYFGSSVYLNEDIMKKNKENFIKIILKIFSNRNDAMEHEINLHRYFDVENNILFYNRHNAKSDGFSWYNKKHSPESIEKIKKRRQKQQITPEQIKKFKDTWKNKTNEEMHEYKKYRKIIWDSKSDTEKKEFKEKMSNIVKEYWQSLPEEEKNDRARKALETKSKWNKEQKERDFKNRSDAQKKAKNNRSPEEIQRFVKRRKNTYRDMPEEKLKEISNKMSKKMKGRKWYNNGHISKMFFENDVPEGFVQGRKF
jgi:isopentenyl diphosphate isomerase/L-lactate dehydrogenase-like FMN-dependent dehydrogenase